MVHEFPIGLVYEILTNLLDSQEKGEKRFLINVIGKIAFERSVKYHHTMPDITALEKRIRDNGLVKSNRREQRDEVTIKGRELLAFFAPATEKNILGESLPFD